MASNAVLDASAVLALLQEERGHELVAERLPGAAISAVNLSEIVAKLSDAGVPEADIRRAMNPLALDVHPFDSASAYLSGLLRAQTRSLGLSLGDRACLALGLTLDRPVITTERAWTRVTLGVEVILAR